MWIWWVIGFVGGLLLFGIGWATGYLFGLDHAVESAFAAGYRRCLRDSAPDYIVAKRRGDKIDTTYGYLQ